MLYLAGQIDTVQAQSYRLALDYGIDDTTSMLFRFAGGATGYLGTIIATAETWRMQVFGSRGWAEVGDVEHLTTWDMKVCYVDPENLHTHQRPQRVIFPQTSTERAELEHFADAVQAGRALAVAGGDEEHGVAVLEAIMESVSTGEPVSVARLRRRATAAAGTRTKTRSSRARKSATTKAVGRASRAVKKARPHAKKERARTAASRKKRARAGAGARHHSKGRGSGKRR
jgi:hypothetical protein